MHKIISRHFIGTGLKPLPGDNWVVQTSGTNTPLRGVAWSGSLFVVVGENGLIRTSPDAVTWSAATSGTTQTLIDVLWTGTQFVCVGAAGTILTSTNGTTWTPQTSGTTLSIQSISFANGTLFAGPATTTGTNVQILTSTNGSSWSTISTACPSLGAGSGIVAVVWNGSSYFATGYGAGFGFIDSNTFSSTNGTTWTHSVYPDLGFGLGDLYWSGTEYVAVGSDGHSTSPTGVTWTIRDAAPAYSLAKGTDRLVSVGGLNGAMKSSTNNITWVSKNSGTTQALSRIIWSGTKFVAVGALGTITTS